MNVNRRIAVLMFLLLGAFSVFAQEQEKKVRESDVPVIVVANFKETYPHATIRGYASEIENGKQYYEVSSREGSVMRDVLYNPDGTIAEVEETIDVTQLPAAALEAFKKHHPRGVITLAEKTVAGDKVTYEIKAREGRKRLEIEFDSAGKPLSKAKP